MGKSSATKQRILDAAKNLFLSKGYESTSISDILKAIDISKGAFYHHFKSKEELLDSLANALADEAMEEIIRIKNENIDAMRKLNLIFSVSRQYKTANKRMVRVYIDAMYRPSNLILLEKLKQSSWGKIAPILVEIVDQGKKEGRFDVSDAKQFANIAGDLAFGLAKATANYILKDRLSEEEWDELERMGDAYARSLERLLGTSTGSLVLMDKHFIDMLRE
jgi:AcrR family transcriptional regulator